MFFEGFEKAAAVLRLGASPSRVGTYGKMLKADTTVGFSGARAPKPQIKEGPALDYSKHVRPQYSTTGEVKPLGYKPPQTT